MYTVVRVRPKGEKRYRWTGFAYDISNTGMRFELDEAVSPGANLEVRVMLPGSPPSTFHATGRVIRLHDDPDDPGPVRMALHFETFRLAADRKHLAGYIAQDHPPLAA